MPTFSAADGVPRLPHIKPDREILAQAVLEWRPGRKAE